MELITVARPGVTYIDVAKAATQLHEQGQRPTIEAVRQHLGTGSNSTINQHLRQWRGHHGNQLESEQGLPESLLIAMKGTYDAMSAEANSQLEKITLEHQQLMDELQEKYTSLEKDHDCVVQQRVQLESRVSQLEEETLGLNQLNQQLNQTIHEKITEASALSDKLSDREVQLARLTQQISYFQTSLDHYRDAIREERVLEKQAFEDECTTLKQQLTTERHIAREATEKNNQLQQSVTQLTSEKQAAVQQHEILIEDHQMLNTDFQKLTWEHDNLQQHVVSQKSELQSQIEVSTDDKNLIATLNITVAKQQEQIAHLQCSAEKSTETIANLRHKNLFLTQEKAELTGQLKQIQCIEDAK